MKTKTIICISLLLIFIFNMQLFAEEKKALNKLGFIFQIESLDTPVDSYSDGLLSGLGLKYWVLKNVTLRALCYLNMFTNDETEETTTLFGAGIAVEYHFSDQKVSPYIGGLGGVATVSPPDEDMIAEGYIGALIGLELKNWSFASIFAEYSLYIIFRELGMEIDLANNYGPTIGVIFYIN